MIKLLHWIWVEIEHQWFLLRFVFRLFYPALLFTALILKRTVQIGFPLFYIVLAYMIAFLWIIAQADIAHYDRKVDDATSAKDE
jgi:predicted permease